MTVVDRRSALKERHRRAILDAAAALASETGGVSFGVDVLAERADVSRRTVFNHFASLDDVVVAVATEVLGSLVDTLVSAAAVPHADEGRSGLLDEAAHALRSTDLVTPMAYLTRILGADQADPTRILGADQADPTRAALMLRTLDEVGGRFAAAMATRHPAADALDVELLVSGLVNGLVVLHRHWYAATGGATDAASRTTWDALVERLLTGLRDGFGPRAPS